ncbi:MAG: hypothetical protein ABJB17_03250 [Burkholderiales bacterium]
MGFISTIQHDGQMFIAGQPRRVPARFSALSTSRAPEPLEYSGWQVTVWPHVQAVATTLWKSARRNVLAAVERVGPEAGHGATEPGSSPTRVRPLRVLHVIDPAARGAGRMVISGRMADVCAELERLAACEARHARC